jgi:hypothetical protein
MFAERVQRMRTENKLSVSKRTLLYFSSFQWKETDANQLMDSKLKCVFVLPEENSSGAMAGNNRDDVSKSDYQSKQAIPASPKVNNKRIQFATER